MSEQRHLTWVAGLTTFLTALTLSPLFQQQPWLWPAFLVVAVVAGVGLGGRAIAMPAVVVALAQVVAATVLILYQFGPSSTRWYGLPTWDTVRAMNDLGIAGQDVINRFSPPVPAETGVVMLTVIGVAAVAITVDLLAVGMRLVPLAGLPLLALYTVPVAVVDDGVPWLLFVLAASSYVGLLVAEGRERLSRWGRSMGYTDREVTMHAFVGEVDTGPVARVGRRIGAAAVCLAVAVPVVIPYMDNGLIGRGVGGAGSGGQSVVTSDPFVDLQRDLRRDDNVAIFTYTTQDPSPDYFRMVTLDTFDGEEWRRAERSLPDDQIITDQLPPALGSQSVPGTQRVTQVQIGENFESRWLPLPYPVTNLAIEDSWAYDAESLNVFGVDRGTTGISYEIQSLELAYDEATPGTGVPEAVRDYLQLPDLPEEVTALADQVTADATTPMEQAMALQAWFRDPAEFRYTLEVAEGHGSSDLVAFVEGREGYCEQFAATMAIMARYLGIPSRVDIGYTPGSVNTGLEWEVTAHDAHAWPELYIDGLGWVRFEPTPSARTGSAPVWSEAEREQPSATPTTSVSPGTNPSVAPTQRGDEFGAAVGSGGGFDFPTMPVLIGLGIVLVLLAPMLARRAMTRRRWGKARTPEELVLTGWEQLKDSAADLRYGWERSDTPRTIAKRLREAAGLQGAPEEALARVARSSERVMFARDAGQVGDIRGDVETVVTALTNAVDRSRRLRARYLPPSTARITHAVSERIADGLDWIEGLGNLLRRAIRRNRVASQQP